MYSTHDERKSVSAEKLIRPLKNKIYKYIASTFKSMYIDELTKQLINAIIRVVDKYNNTYQRTVKINSIYINICTYIDFDVKNNDTDPRFKVADHVRVSKYKNILKNDYTTNWSEEVFVVKDIKILYRQYTLLVILTVKKLLQSFMKKIGKKSNKVQDRKIYKEKS